MKNIIISAVVAALVSSTISAVKVNDNELPAHSQSLS